LKTRTTSVICVFSREKKNLINPNHFFCNYRNSYRHDVKILEKGKTLSNRQSKRCTFYSIDGRRLQFTCLSFFILLSCADLSRPKIKQRSYQNASSLFPTVRGDALLISSRIFGALYYHKSYVHGKILVECFVPGPGNLILYIIYEMTSRYHSKRGFRSFSSF
jgi:hypothetical protein